MVTRRKVMANREASGRVKRDSHLPSPAEVIRLRDAALAGMRDPVWGSMLGLLFLAGKINALQFAAGKRWNELAADYSRATLAPKQPRSANLDPKGGTPADPDSAQGRREARRQVLTLEDYQEALNVLKRLGGPVLAIVVDICEGGRVPGGFAELQHLKRGLSALAGADDRKMGQRS
jgi:hypothetical protein